VFSYASTAIVEALEMGVPSVSFDYLNRGDVFKMDSASIVRTSLMSALPEITAMVCKRGASDREDVLDRIISKRGCESAQSAADAIAGALR